MMKSNHSSLTKDSYYSSFFGKHNDVVSTPTTDDDVNMKKAASSDPSQDVRVAEEEENIRQHERPLGRLNENNDMNKRRSSTFSHLFKKDTSSKRRYSPWTEHSHYHDSSFFGKHDVCLYNWS